MEILVVPDIHGRDFWKEPCRNWQGLIVFLEIIMTLILIKFLKINPLKKQKEGLMVLTQLVLSNMDIVNCIKRQRKEWDLQGYNIIFPNPYKYLNIYFNDFKSFCKWFDDSEYQKYMNFDPPIDRINGYTGNILLEYVILNNTTNKKE